MATEIDEQQNENVLQNKSFSSTLEENKYRRGICSPSKFILKKTN